jgi:hypothetical protein
MSRSMLLVAGACAVELLLAAELPAADQLAPVGSLWVGTFKRFGEPDSDGNRISSTDAQIKITERDGDKYKAELWLDNRSKGLALEGTISVRGGMKGSPTKVLKGEFAPDIVGRAPILGSVKDGTMQFKMGNAKGGRVSEIEVKRKEPD